MRRRRRRDQQSAKLWIGLAKFTLFTGFIAAVGYNSYLAGQRLSQNDIAGRNAEIERLNAAAQAQDKTIAELRDSVEQARRETQDYKSRLDQVAISDDMKELMGALRGKIAAGVDPKRLAFLIAAADRPRNCQPATAKRFVVRIPGMPPSSATMVNFANSLTVTADGAALPGTNGAAPTVFDPSQPVTVHFTEIGGKQDEVTGKLPLSHSLVVKNNEYRFTIAPNAKGFVEVSGDRCDFRL